MNVRTENWSHSFYFFSARATISFTNQKWVKKNLSSSYLNLNVEEETTECQHIQAKNTLISCRFQTTIRCCFPECSSLNVLCLSCTILPVLPVERNSMRFPTKAKKKEFQFPHWLKWIVNLTQHGWSRNQLYSNGGTF